MIISPIFAHALFITRVEAKRIRVRMANIGHHVLQEEKVFNRNQSEIVTGREDNKVII